jgi:hypothetical protein
LTLGALKKLRQMGLAPAVPAPLPSSLSAPAPATSSTAAAAGSDKSDAFSGPQATADQDNSLNPRLHPESNTTAAAAATETTQRKKRWTFALLFAVNRILRLLPLYAACVFFWWHVAPRWGNGPFWFVWEGKEESVNNDTRKACAMTKMNVLKDFLFCRLFKNKTSCSLLIGIFLVPLLLLLLHLMAYMMLVMCVNYHIREREQVRPAVVDQLLVREQRGAPQWLRNLGLLLLGLVIIK